MSGKWREEAARRFPDLVDKLSEADSPGMFWIDLHFDFEDAYDTNRHSRIAEIYDFAKWCCEQPPGNTASDDLGTIVATHFFEHIPAHPRALEDMPKWWAIEDVRVMKKIFSYLVGDEGYAKVLARFGVK